MDFKTCSDCKEAKRVSEFYKNKTKTGFYYSSICKKCAIIRVEKYRKTAPKEVKEKISARRKIYRENKKQEKETWFKKIYAAMKKRNRNKFGLELCFSLEEFQNWVSQNYQEEFHKMFSDYVKSGFDKAICPSIDRIDDYKGYSFDNMQLLTWEENNKKGRECQKNKKSCAEVATKYCSKTVIQFDTNMNFIREYKSAHEVERETGFRANLIARACRRNRDGFRCVSKGYIWFYKNDYYKELV